MIPQNITREHIVKAINEIRKSGIPFHRESVRWSLVYNGQQFPPKYVVSLANKFANDRELDPSQFSGGHETNSFLRELGFEIVEKSGWGNLRVWLEKVYVKGKKHKEEGDYALGKAMLSPQKDRRGADIYRNMRLAKRGDLVLHLIDNEAIVGISKVAEEHDAAPGFLYLRHWDNQTGRDPGYLVKLEGFIRFRNPLKRSDILNERFRDELISIQDSEDNVFYTSGMNLRQGAYLTAVPSKLLALINLVHREKNGSDLPYLGVTENNYTFQLTEDDFEACRRSEKTNYIKPVRRKFEEILKPELIRALGKNFEDFVTGGRHPSPYVANVWTRSGGGHYRDHMWIGFAHKKYEDPRNGIQFQFGINRDSIFSLGLWIEGRGYASRAKTEAKERIDREKRVFLNLLRRLGDNYWINAWPPGEEEIVEKANELKEENLDTWVELIERDGYYFQIYKDLSKEKAIEIGTSIVEEIAATFEELLPLYNLFAGIEEEVLPPVRYAILMSANIEQNPGVFAYHQEHIRRVGATYWGVGFPVDPTRLTLPINGYFYATDARKVTRVARIEEIETYDSPQMPKELRLRPPEYKDEMHRTYFRFSELERLPDPMEIHDFTQWNGEKVVRPPQNYVLVMDPTGLIQPLDLQSSSIKTELIVNETVLEQVCANLNSGSHLIITGPVGTGKTSLSEDLCRAAKENRFCDGYVLTTASSDWTTFDTIGGYMPTEEGKLKFEQGKFLEAIEENKWLIIDEINRADIDKAFGQLFTVLSGQRVELPFKHSSGKTVSIEPTTEDRSYFDNAEATYKVGRNWRIIATMNVYDMNFLFEMSYAFMRRFAFVYLDIPERFEELIDKWCAEKRISNETKEKLKEMTRLTERKMGPAIIKDIVEYIEQRGDGERELAEAVIAYILPQLEGLEREKIERTWDQIGKVFTEKEIPNGIIRPILREIVGIELKEISE